MSALRLAARSALRPRPSTFRAAAPLLRRGYADAVPDKIQLSLVLPHQVRLSINWVSIEPQGVHLRALANV